MGFLMIALCEKAWQGTKQGGSTTVSSQESIFNEIQKRKMSTIHIGEEKIFII